MSTAWLMDEDDNSSSILESSLFYSCMSSATAFDVGDTNDESKHGIPNEEVDACSPPSACHGVDLASSRTGARPSNPPIAAANDNAASDPSSGSSSWSVLSESERPSVRSLSFNRDRTCLIASTTAGVRIRTLESLQLSLQNLRSGEENGPTGRGAGSWIHDVPLPPDGATYAQLLHETSLLATVRPSSPRCCFLYNARSPASPLAALPLSAAVKRVELQRTVLAAMTVDLRLHVFRLTEGGGEGVREAAANTMGKLRPTLITTLNIMHPSDTPRNVTRGMDGFNAGSYFDLSTNEDEPYLACKSFNGTPGTVRVYDPTIIHTMASVPSCNASVGSGSTNSSWDNRSMPSATKRAKRRISLLATIAAHDHAVTRMVIGGGGVDGRRTLLATASVKGTAIRIFGLPDGARMWEWHRGSRPCRFHSLSWNGAADRLASYGSSGTVHVFDWDGEAGQTDVGRYAGSGDDEDEDDEGAGFERVRIGAQQRSFDELTTGSAGSRRLLRRIGSSIQRRTSSAGNTEAARGRRSMARLRYKPLPARVGAATDSARTQQLVLALLDRNHGGDGRDDPTEREDALVLCSMDGELRQYSVKSDKSISLIQIEDVLARGY